MFWVALSAFLITFLPWCSMLPDDEDIIKWSVSENEIFWDESFNDGLDGNESEKQEIVEDEIFGDYEISEDLDTTEDDEGWSSEVDVDVVQ